MKKINILLFAFMAVTFFSCKKEYVEPEFKTEFFGIYGSMYKHGDGPANINPTYLETYKNAGIMDISQGFLSHEWSFWKDVNNGEGEPDWVLVNDEVKFLKEGSNLGYQTIKDFTPYYDLNIKPVNSEDQINFIFEKGGKYKLTINNTYRNQIDYIMEEPYTILGYNVNRYYKAQPTDNNEFLVDHSLEFEIYDTLNVKAQVFEDAECTIEKPLTPEGITQIAVSQGSTLYFKDATGTSKYDSGTSRDWNWTCIEGDNLEGVIPSTSTDLVSAFIFSAKGKYQVSLHVKIENLAIQNFPNSERTKTLPLTVIVE